MKEQAARAEFIYGEQLRFAGKIVPELESLNVTAYKPGCSGFDPVECASEVLNFYNNFDADLLTYQIVWWMGEGGKYRLCDQNSSFRLYPTIGQLTAISISKIRSQNMEEVISSYFIGAHISRLLLNIDMLFGLYSSQVSEAEAHKKL